MANKKGASKPEPDDPDDNPVVKRLLDIASQPLSPTKGFVSLKRIPRALAMSRTVSETGHMGGVPFNLTRTHFRLH